MMQAKILLVSDDLETSRVWAYGLGQHGWQTIIATSAGEALLCWEREPFDLIIINIYSSELDGINLCRQLRPEVANPILLFTPVNEEPKLLEAYEAGADECIAKPIGIRLFLVKVNAWLRRSWNMPAEVLNTLQSGQFRLDPIHRQLALDGNGTVVKLTNLEFRLLHLLMSHPGQALETSQIVARVWGYSGDGDSTLLKNVVYRLRRKIEPDPACPRYLQTATGHGYTFHP